MSTSGRRDELAVARPAATKRFVKQQVPDDILHDEALNVAIAVLPHNYNFEVPDCFEISNSSDWPCLTLPCCLPSSAAQRNACTSCHQSPYIIPTMTSQKRLVGHQAPALGAQQQRRKTRAAAKILFAKNNICSAGAQDSGAHPAAGRQAGCAAVPGGPAHVRVRHCRPPGKVKTKQNTTASPCRDPVPEE